MRVINHRTVFVLAVLFILISCIGNSIILQASKYNDHLALTGELPPRFSWLDIEGVDFSTPVKNQAPCPSCEAYALIAALETMVQYKVGYPFNCDLSEMHLFLCSGGTCSWGVNITRCMGYLLQHGVPDEGCFPDPQRTWDTPCEESLPDWENRTVKISRWGWVENNPEAIKHSLIEYGPLVICVLVRQDFMFYQGGSYKNIWGGLKGGHIITIFGYDDIERYWLIKNSWGTSWGEDGWIRVSYDAERALRPFIWPFYGGTGILYMDGIYGNFQPEVPTIHIENLQRDYTFFNNISWKPSLFRKLFLNSGEPILVEGAMIKLNVSADTRNVKVYVDKKFRDNLTSSPFQWYFRCETFGVHELKVIAYNNKNNVSQDILDVYTIPWYFPYIGY